MYAMSGTPLLVEQMLDMPKLRSANPFDVRQAPNFGHRLIDFPDAGQRRLLHLLLRGLLMRCSGVDYEYASLLICSSDYVDPALRA